ncbi:hypothetical protein BLOT_007846 [Blomia tropicalis]|nr:hypothetical protein BLOT_007846 [Blomia tropicalis]
MQIAQTPLTEESFCRHVAYHCFREQRSLEDSFVHLLQVYGDGFVTLAQIESWFNEFRTLNISYFNGHNLIGNQLPPPTLAPPPTLPSTPISTNGFYDYHQTNNSFESFFNDEEEENPPLTNGDEDNLSQYSLNFSSLEDIDSSNLNMNQFQRPTTTMMDSSFGISPIGSPNDPTMTMLTMTGHNDNNRQTIVDQSNCPTTTNVNSTTTSKFGVMKKARKITEEQVDEFIRLNPNASSKQIEEYFQLDSNTMSKRMRRLNYWFDHNRNCCWVKKELLTDEKLFQFVESSGGTASARKVAEKFKIGRGLATKRLKALGLFNLKKSKLPKNGYLVSPSTTTITAVINTTNPIVNSLHLSSSLWSDINGSSIVVDKFDDKSRLI